MTEPVPTIEPKVIPNNVGKMDVSPYLTSEGNYRAGLLDLLES
mgnify:CR=1 FL=1